MTLPPTAADGDPKGAAPVPQTTEEAVRLVLTHLGRQAGRSDAGAAYDGLLRVPDLPLEALGELGSLTRLDDGASKDALPSLLLETESGQLQIELCPFGPLALLSSDGQADTDPPASLLHAAGLFPLFPADLDGAGGLARPPPRPLALPHPPQPSPGPLRDPARLTLIGIVV